MIQPRKRGSIWQRKWKWWQQVLVFGSLIAISRGLSSGSLSTTRDFLLAGGAWLALVVAIVILNARTPEHLDDPASETANRSRPTNPLGVAGATIGFVVGGVLAWGFVSYYFFNDPLEAPAPSTSQEFVTASSPSSNWQRVTTADFSASMPVQPTVEHQTVNVPPVGDVAVSTYFAGTDDESVGVFVSHYDFDLGTEHTRSRLVGAEEGLLSDTPNLVRTSSRWTTFQNREAREMDGTAGNLTARYLIFLEGQDLYALFMIDDSLEPALWQHFVDSFSITL